MIEENQLDTETDELINLKKLEENKLFSEFFSISTLNLNELNF